MELEAAALWDEARQTGLGQEFLAEYQVTLEHILRHPERWRIIRDDNRQLKFHRFPYALVYSVQGEAIYIKAVMHMRRRPFYWQHRS